VTWGPGWSGRRESNPHRELGKHSRTAPDGLMLQLGGHGHRPWVSVDDRCRPMLRARWGHGRRGRTRRRRAGDGHQLDRRVRPLLVTACLVGKSRQSTLPPHAYSESRSGRGRGPITPGIEHEEAEHGHAGRGHHAKSTLNRLPTSATNHCEKSALSPRSMELAHSAKTLRSGPMNKARRRAEAPMPRPFLMRFASTLHQVQISLSVTNSTVVSPLAFTVKCAWNVTKALDPSDPCATARK
jgi:hypothetical protein